MALAMSPSSPTVNSYASEAVRMTTFLPSGDFAAPVTRLLPTAPNPFSVPVAWGVKSPTLVSSGRFSRTSGCRGALAL